MRRPRRYSGRPEPGIRRHFVRSRGSHQQLNGSATAFEILYGALVLLCLVATVECPQISPFAGLWVLLPRIQSILAGLEFSDHLFSGSGMSMIQRHVLKRRWLAVPFHLRSEDLPTVLAARACPWLARSAVDGHRMRSG